jgi:hypothetical protein
MEPSDAAAAEFVYFLVCGEPASGGSAAQPGRRCGRVLRRRRRRRPAAAAAARDGGAQAPSGGLAPNLAAQPGRRCGRAPRRRRHSKAMTVILPEMCAYFMSAGKCFPGTWPEDTQQARCACIWLSVLALTVKCKF